MRGWSSEPRRGWSSERSVTSAVGRAIDACDSVGDVAAHELAGLGPRKFAPHPNEVRRERAAQLAAEVSAHGVGVEGMPGRRYNHGFEALSPLLVGNADYRCVAHVFARQQHVLDLRWRDVLAPTDDGVVGASTDI